MGDEKHFCENFEDADKKVRKYVFTSFHDDPPVLTAKMQYLLYAPEYCPTTGKKHWQCYVIYKERRARNAVRKELKCWANIALGDIDTQIAYIKGPYNKDGKTKPVNPNAVELGEPDSQGVSSDVKTYFDEIKSKKRRVSNILNEDPMHYHTYGRTMLALEDLHDRNRERTPAKLYFIHTSELDKWPHDNSYWLNSHWACDYEHEPIIFINMDRTHWTITDLKLLHKGYPFHMDRKNRTRISLTATTLIFFSEYSLDKYFKDQSWVLSGCCWENWSEIVDNVLRSQQ